MFRFLCCYFVCFSLESLCFQLNISRARKERLLQVDGYGSVTQHDDIVTRGPMRPLEHARFSTNEVSSQKISIIRIFSDEFSS